MFQHSDYSGKRSWEDMIRHRVRLPGFYPAWAARFLYEKAPQEFEAEQVGMDNNGEVVYALFWHEPVFQTWKSY